MKKLLIISITLILSLLSIGCNTKEIHHGNIRAYFWPKIDNDAPAKHLIIGLPDNPYKQEQNLKLIYKDGSVINFDSNELLKKLSLKYEKPYISSLDNKVGPGLYPGKSYPYPNGLISYRFSVNKVIYQKDKIWSLNFSLMNIQNVNVKNRDLPDSQFITAISINGKLIHLPITEQSLINAFGAPDKRLEYLSQ